jgi:chemotaxis protein MotA
MDPGTIAGVGAALAAIFVSMIMEGGNPASILLPPALLLVFVGTLGVALAGNMLKDFTGALGALKTAFLAAPSSDDETIATIVSFADKARREGLLALEEAARGVDDPFLRKGIELAVDGTDPDELREILEAELQSKKSADKVHAKVFGDMGAYGPTLGIIGTVLGLIHVLENLSDPGKLGHLIAGAFVATLWGVLSANIFWFPISKKLERVAAVEAKHMELVLEGVLSIQAGANPRVVEQKLLSFLTPAEREAATPVGDRSEAKAA